MSNKFPLKLRLIFFTMLLYSSMVIGQFNEKKYPDFSWDQIQLCFHFGNNNRLLSDDEISFITDHSNIICLEKAHGIGEMGYTEKGIATDASRLKLAKPDMKVIFYWNAFLDYKMYKASKTYNQHPEWWLKDKNGNLDYKSKDLKRYDLSNPAVRKWWVDIAYKGVTDYNCDGVFMDAFPQVNASANIDLWGQEKYDAINQGLHYLVKETRERLGQDKLILFNGIRTTDAGTFGTSFYEHGDAPMMEHFGVIKSATKEAMLADIQAMQAAGKKGKMVIFKGWPGEKGLWINKEFMAHSKEEKEAIAKREIVFPLACFLIGAQEYAYFSYSWGYQAEHGFFIDYPEYHKKLGKPLSDYKKNGWVLTRDFEYAKVWVNLENRTAKIDWKE
ncbi:putative glycoside hydrolase [Joostella sp.]|uniref:putative glycoside hydrolase n=1 Tax=Joostella sp. TaxID=2231138 RepID=UPI003A8FD64A